MSSSTSSISSMLNSKNRLFGLNSGSGLDVDSLVEKLMKTESEKVNKVKRSRAYLDWQKTAYREVTTSLTSLKSKYLNVTSSTNLMSSSATNKNKVSVSNTSVVSATASSTAGEATHTVEVTQIAKVGATTGTSYLKDPAVTTIDGSKTMTEFTGKTLGTSVLTIGSQSFKIENNSGTGTTETIQQFCTRVSGANSTYDVTYTAGADAGTGTITMNLKKVGGVDVPRQNVSGVFLQKAGLSIDVDTASVASFANVTASNYQTQEILTIDGQKYYAASMDEKISTFLSRVNAANSSYRINYDETANQFVVTTKNTGEDTGNATGAFLQYANLTSDSTTKLNLGTNNGQNAKFTIDGIDYESTSNSYALGGITYTMLAEGTSNVVTSRDIDTIVKNIQDFVTDYNKIIDNLNTKTTEKKYRDYTPLTDEEKSEMKDSDIELWEEKAKSGMLKGDSLLTSISDKLKEVMYSQYTLSDGSKMSLSEIGIGSTSYLDKGKLTVDETKLRKALAENPEKVTELLTKQSDISYNADGNNTQRHKENGVFANVSDILNDYVRTSRDTKGNKGLLIEKAGTTGDASEYKNSISKLIDDKDDLITELLDKLADKEDYYYKKFTAMETAISKMNSQSSSLTNMLGS